MWAGPESPTGEAHAQGTVRKGPIARPARIRDRRARLPRRSRASRRSISAALFARDPETQARSRCSPGPLAKPATLLIDRSCARDPRARRRRGSHARPAARCRTRAILTDLARRRHRARSCSRLRRSAARAGGSTTTSASIPSAPVRHAAGRHALADARARRREPRGGVGDDPGCRARRRTRCGRRAGAFPGSRVRGRRPTTDSSASSCTSPACSARSAPAELSDGTLRYLLLCAALLPARPAPAHRAQRARGEPASRPARAPRRAHRRGVQPGRRWWWSPTPSGSPSALEAPAR